MISQASPQPCVLVLLTVLLFAVVGDAHAQRSRIAPEAASGRYAKSVALAEKFMVAAANPLAVDAGVEMLRKGGSAVDAAIAVQLVLNLVEPQSSGIGGGAFLLHWDKAAKDLKTYDGREMAPATATPDRFLKAGFRQKGLSRSDRRKLFRKIVKSGLSIGVPGLVHLLEHAHRRHGKLPWKELFAPAIKLAEEGFSVSPRLNFLLEWATNPETFTRDARNYFYGPDGKPHPIGYLLRNPAFAETLKQIRDRGVSAFYSGPVAEAMVKAAGEAPNFAGDLSMADLESYEVKERPAVCTDYRGYRVCGMGPPSSGALTVAQILKLSERFDLGTIPRHAMSTHALHVLGEAGKLAFADRNRYIGDSDFVDVPTGLLNSSYLAARSKLINPARVMDRPRPGTPPKVNANAFGVDATRESVGTSHISIVDASGNAVSMTTTIESAFGSGVWAAGFLLNNELTDFSFKPVDSTGRPIANRVEPRKRPRSSMAPTIVFDKNGDFFAAVGSPGGSRIILYVAKALVAMIDWKLDPQAAVALANFGSRGGNFELEYDPHLATVDLLTPWATTPSIWYAIRLRALGHKVRPDLMTSGLHIVARRNGRLEGGADPRREGVARGE